jgi:hypothetical protein
MFCSLDHAALRKNATAFSGLCLFRGVKFSLPVAFSLVFGALSCGFAQESSDKPATVVEIRGPNVRPGLPDAFSLGYELYPNTVSSDGKFGVIFADARRGYISELIARNFLVALNPFRILAPNESFAYFGPHGGREMVVEWTRDSSAALVLLGWKWGTIGATLFELRDGRVTRRTDLMAEIFKLLKPRFPKGKVKPYNDMMLITPDGNDDWAFSEDGKQLRIELASNTAPNLAPGKQWSASFKGVWSVPQGKWTQQKITSRIYNNPE